MNIYNRFVVVATAKVQIFKQITTIVSITFFLVRLLLLPQRYKFSSKSQLLASLIFSLRVVVATAKVQIFKQITTLIKKTIISLTLLLLPQRYKFSSKSQPMTMKYENSCVVVATAKVQIFKQITTYPRSCYIDEVVVATAKVQIFKQITTRIAGSFGRKGLLLLPQRYKFSSKSQPKMPSLFLFPVVVATAKVQIFKQITTSKTIK